MGFDRFDTALKPLSNLFGREPLDDKTHDIALTWCQTLPGLLYNSFSSRRMWAVDNRVNDLGQIIEITERCLMEHIDYRTR